MKFLVIYFSNFGNTRKIAEAVAGILKSEADTRVISFDRLTFSDFNGSDIVVMGVPTHQMNLPEAVKTKIGSFPRRVMHHIPFAAFDTSYKMSHWLAHFTAGRKLAHRLRRLGGRQLLPAESFYVKEKEGPLYEGEIERARIWTKDILAQGRDSESIKNDE